MSGNHNPYLILSTENQVLTKEVYDLHKPDVIYADSHEEALDKLSSYKVYDGILVRVINTNTGEIKDFKISQLPPRRDFVEIPT